jgi:hypothetical protein
MKEIIANYHSDIPLPFHVRKWRGLVNTYFKMIRELNWRLHILFHPIQYDTTKIAPDSIPILINNFNRLDVLQEQLPWILSLEGKKSILIIDNKSTYQPLLAYYAQLQDIENVQVVMLGYNSWRKGAAHLATRLLKQFPHVIITDPDLFPYHNTPTDLVPYLVRLINLFPDQNHIGLSLEINDIPEHNPLRDRIVLHESKFWKQPLAGTSEKVFVAAIDTTFAIYRKGSKIEAIEPALRTDRPYTLKHIDWYQDPNNTTAEYKQYIQSAKLFATWATELKQMLKR